MKYFIGIFFISSKGLVWDKGKKEMYNRYFIFNF